MPVFEIGLDDGRKLHIDAESQEAALSGVQHFLGQPKSDEPSGVIAGAGHGYDEAKNAIKATAKNYLGVGSGPEPSDPNYVPAHVVDTNGSYNPLKWDVHADQIPQKIAEEAPGLAQHIAAATAGAKTGRAIGGIRGAALGGFLGGAGSMWASRAGNAAKEDAVARTGDANAEPNGSDLTRAGLTSAASAAAQAITPTRFIPGANKVLGVGAQGALQGIQKYLGTTALGGITGAAGNAIDQAGNTIGTDKGLSVDGDQVLNAGVGGAVTAGAMGAPRGIADVAGAARRAEFGGANQAATAAVAARLAQNAGSDGLGGVFNGKRDFRAMEATQKGLRNELHAVDDSGFNQDQQNALALARSGSPLTPEHVDAINAADPAAGHLANQLHMSQKMTDFGTYDRSNGVWSGGLSGKMDKLMRNYVDPTKVAVGAAAGKVMGLHLLGTASPAFAGAAAGTYGLARMADAMTGARSPAKSFAEQFASMNAQTRLVPTTQQAQQQQQAAQQAQQAAQPGPWGPRPAPTTSVPQVAPGSAQASAASLAAKTQADANWKVMREQADSENKHHDLLWKILRDQADSENKGRDEASNMEAKLGNADYKVQQAQALSENKARDAMTSASLKQQIANAKVQRAQADSENKAVDANWRAGVTQAHSENQTLNKDFSANQAQALSENKARELMTSASLRQQIANARVQRAQADSENKAVDANWRANVTQAHAANQTVNKDFRANHVQAESENRARDRAAEEEAAAAAPAKITKTNGGPVKTQAVPQTLHAAVTPPGPQPTDFYRQLDPSEMRFQGKEPGFIADTLAKERMVGKPQEVVDNYKKSVLDTHTERRGIVKSIIERNPLDAPKLQELIDQLHERGSRDQGMAAVRHYAKQVSPQAAGDLLSGFNDTAAQRIWATPAEKKAARAALKKKHSKT